jgi:hypothetical protein
MTMAGLCRLDVSTGIRSPPFPVTIRLKAGEVPMTTLELVLLIVAAAGFAVWRGVALYRHGHKKGL